LPIWLEAPAREGGSQGGPPGSNRRTTGPGHGPSDPGHDLGQSGSSQVKDGSGEPSEWTTGIDHDGPPGPLREPRRRQGWWARLIDRKSTRLNSSHVSISYAVFCLKKNTIDGVHE